MATLKLMPHCKNPLFHPVPTLAFMVPATNKPCFSLYTGTYQLNNQAANAYSLDPLTYNSFSSRSQYYTDQLENPFYQANQAYSTFPGNRYLLYIGPMQRSVLPLWYLEC